MYKLKYDFVLGLVKFFNLIIMTVPFGLCWKWFYEGNLAIRESHTESILITFIFMLAYFAFGKVYDAFLISYSRISEMIYSQVLALIMANGILYVLVTLLMLKLPDPTP